MIYTNKVIFYSNISFLKNKVIWLHILIIYKLNEQ